MGSYRKKNKQEIGEVSESNPNLRRAIPGVSADNYESVEGLGEQKVTITLNESGGGNIVINAELKKQICNFWNSI